MRAACSLSWFFDFTLIQYKFEYKQVAQCSIDIFGLELLVRKRIVHVNSDKIVILRTSLHKMDVCILFQEFKMAFQINGKIAGTTVPIMLNYFHS